MAQLYMDNPAIVTGNPSDHSIYLRVSGVYIHESTVEGVE